MIAAILEITLAYIAADFLSGMYHLVTDRGWNIPSQLSQFNNHHERPWTMTFDWEPLLAGLPMILAGWWLSIAFLVWLGVFLSLAQVPHYYAHHPAPRWIVFLQEADLILPVELHAAHHEPPHNKDFCVLSGWTNGLINAIEWMVPIRRSASGGTA